MIRPDQYHLRDGMRRANLAIGIWWIKWFLGQTIKIALFSHSDSEGQFDACESQRDPTIKNISSTNHPAGYNRGFLQIRKGKTIQKNGFGFYIEYHPTCLAGNSFQKYMCSTYLRRYLSLETPLCRIVYVYRWGWIEILIARGFFIEKYAKWCSYTELCMVSFMN